MSIELFYGNYLDSAQFGDDSLLAKYLQQQPESGAQLTMVSQRHGMAITAWQMKIKKLMNAVLVELTGRERAAGHPMGEMRQCVNVTTK